MLLNLPDMRGRVQMGIENYNHQWAPLYDSTATGLGFSSNGHSADFNFSVAAQYSRYSSRYDMGEEM